MKERFYDTERMILANSGILSQYPAQLYYSALPFVPSDTYLARQYPIPRDCISVVTGRESSWTPFLFTLPRGEVAFAPNGHMVAVAPPAEDRIQIYNASNGLLNSSIKRISSTSPSLAAFTEDGSGVVVVSSHSSSPESSYEIEKFNLVEQSSQIWTARLESGCCPKLSEYGSYIAFAEHKDRDTRVRIWKTDGRGDISIPLDCGGKVQDFDLAGESVHLVAVAAKDITILSIPSGAVKRTLYHESAEYVHISRDGSFLASWTRKKEARLWSITQGTLLATFELGGQISPVFSRTNRLYVGEFGSVRVYDPSADPNNVTFSLPSDPWSILPMPDESRILIHTRNDIQVWSLRQSMDRDASRDNIIGIDLSHDASLLALATKTGIEIWDARIGQFCKVIQSRSDDDYRRPVAFSPKGELIASLSDDGIIVVDVGAGELMPMTYSYSPPRGQDLGVGIAVQISFDSSKLAAIQYQPWLERGPGRVTPYICVWNLPSGTLLHSLECNGFIDEIRWSLTDQYLLFKPQGGNPRYLNAETFQEELLEHPGDHFRRPNYLYYDKRKHKIRLNGREGPLLLALPLNLHVKYTSSRRDRAGIISGDGRLLLLDTSGLEAYMQLCNL